ncbi:MAG: hypothetical protein ACI9JN_000057 [Bacteroidia bacterium]|jgi:hypothetical protein
MKHFHTGFVVFLLLFGFSCGSIKNIGLEPDYKLKYDIITGQKSVRLEVLVVKDKPEWIFEYTIKEENLSGRIKSTAKAIDSSSELFHTFNGLDKTQTSATSLKISRHSYQQLKLGESVDLSYRIGFVKNTLPYKVVENKSLKYLIDGKLRMLNVLYIEDTLNKGHSLWVWDNPNAPIILRLNFGNEIVIKEIETQ